MQSTGTPPCSTARAAPASQRTEGQAGCGPCPWRQPSKQTSEPSSSREARRLTCESRRRAAPCQTQFPIQQIGKNPQSCSKDPDTSYPFKRNIKTHQFVFAHNRAAPFGAGQGRAQAPGALTTWLKQKQSWDSRRRSSLCKVFN